MKSRMLLTRIPAITLFAVLAATAGLTAQDQGELNRKQTHYSVTALGTLGGSFSWAKGINNKGWVTGVANLLGDNSQHAFLWANGQMTDLGTLGGPNSAVYWPVKDDTGVIAGLSDTSATDPLGENLCGFGTPYTCLGFLWQNGVMTPLPTLGGNNSAAMGVNNRGQVIGFAENDTRDPACIPPQVLDWKPVVWEQKDSEIHELPLFPGDSIGGATAINDRGQIVGGSGGVCQPPSPTSTDHALLWQDGSVIDLGTFGGKTSNLATAINNQGQVAGFSDLPGDTTAHAFLWQNGVMTDLGTLPGDVFSHAYGINNKGQVTGWSCDVNGNCRAFLWQDGVMTDLNTLISPGSLYLIIADDINSQGEIVGLAFDQTTGDVPAYLAIPTHGAGSSPAQGGSPTSKITLPEKVRELLRRRKGFGRVGPGPMRPQ